MKDFYKLFEDSELNKIISSINEGEYFLCHGRYHADFVANTIEYILGALNYSERIVEIGKIAGAFHDIGCIGGKKGHAQKSVEMSEKFLNKTDLSESEKNIIIQAISDHSNGDNIISPVGAALLIADKIDLSKDRVLNNGLVSHKNLLEIKRVNIFVIDSAIIIDYISTDKFSPVDLFKLWKKAFIIPKKAAEYLKCSCEFRVNGETITL